MIAALVLAAGASSRMGKPKQTLLLDGVPMLERVLNTLRRSDIGRVVVVLGASAVKVRKRIKFVDELVVVNPRYAEGMSSSLRLGLKHVGTEAEAVLIVLGDQPFVGPATIDRLVSTYESSRARIVIPTHNGMRGNPVLFRRSVFPQIAEIRGDVGAKEVVQKNAGGVLEVEVPDRGVLVDIDTPSDVVREMKVKRKRSQARG